MSESTQIGMEAGDKVKKGVAEVKEAGGEHCQVLS